MLGTDAAFLDPQDGGARCAIACSVLLLGDARRPGALG
jgi:hypothetical protein